MTSSNQPRKDDVVLGGQASSFFGAVILGGWEGVKARVASPIAETRMAALAEALQHGQKGLDLVVRALNDPAVTVQQAAYSLLQERAEPKAKQAAELYYTRIHYIALQRSLAAQQWQVADQETKAAFHRLCGLSLSESFTAFHAVEIPCQDLRIIDRLWIKYSKGRFGFSVQQRLWQKYDARYWDKAEVWRVFANRVGWRVSNPLVDNHWKRYQEISFTSRAPVGHLPYLGDNFGIFTVGAIAQRLSACELE